MNRTAPINEDVLIFLALAWLLLCKNNFEDFNLYNLAYAHYSMSVIAQFCKVLNIYAFKNGKREEVKKE